MINRYCKFSKISEAKIRDVVRYFSADLTALQTAKLSGLNRNTVNRVYRALRERIHMACEAQRPMFGVVEVDESLFGAKRVKGKRGHTARQPSLVSSSATVWFTRKSFLIAQSQRYRALFEGKFCRKVSLIPMAGEATTVLWTLVTDTTVSIIRQTNLCVALHTLTASKAFGAWQKLGSPSSKGCQNIPFIYT